MALYVPGGGHSVRFRLAQPELQDDGLVGGFEETESARFDRGALAYLPAPGASVARLLLRAQEAERRRIARDLHDVVGQALAVVKLRLGAARMAAPPEHAGGAEFEELAEAIEVALRQVRSYALDLRPSVLDDLGLVPAIRTYLERQVRATGMTVTLNADDLGGLIHPDFETACFRIIQEATANVIRHAAATAIDVRISLDAGELRLEVADDGAGFDASELASAPEGTGLGILGMQERAGLLGGHVEICSAPGLGTSVVARFPVGGQIHAVGAHAVGA